LSRVPVGFRSYKCRSIYGTMSTDDGNNNIPEVVVGELKYNSVFLNSTEAIERLALNGYGAKQFHRLLPTKYQTMLDPSLQEKEKEENYDGDCDDMEEGDVGDEEEEGNGKASYQQALDTKSSAGTSNGSGSGSGPTDEDDEVRITTNLSGDQSSCPMMLFDEEAFYLYYHNRISVVCKDVDEVSLEYLWSKFVEKNDKFPLKYKVYEHFRDKGYVVKTGIHFGLDYAIYRTLPTLCHSEMCAIVIDSLQLQSRTITDMEEGKVESTGQVGWRHLSTLTRVMPDVMKLLGLCYVLPKQKNTHSNMNDDNLTLDSIFGLDVYTPIDLSTPACIDQIEVRVVTSSVRRLVVSFEKYPSIRDVQAKYRSCSILKFARQQQVVRKKRKKRRDHLMVREKTTSKNKAHWKALLR
jgi:hypothetical protein